MVSNPLPPAHAPAAAQTGSDPRVASVDARALIAVLVGVALGTLDTAIANTALPAIGADLHASPAASIWIINAYQLAVVASLLPCAAIGDRLGPRKVFLFGLVFFTLASLACVLAHSLPMLALARALQGIGGGAVMSVNIALIRQIFPPNQLGRGVGFNALVVGVAFALGPTVASLVLTVAHWPWLFGINIPLGLLAIRFAWTSLPRSPVQDHHFDPWAAVLASVTFATLIFAMAEVGQQDSWQRIAATTLFCSVTATLLLRRQAGHAAPMLPVDLLARPMFALSIMTAFASFAAQGLAFVSLPFYFERVLLRDPVETGFLMTAWPVVVAAAAPIAGRLSDRHPPGLLGGVGLAVLALGLAMLATLPANPSATAIVVRMAVCGAGFGFFQSPNLRAIMTSAPAHRAGGASGMVGLVRLLGQTSGAALVALCFGLEGLQGPTWALSLAAVFAALASAASFSRLWPSLHRPS